MWGKPVKGTVRRRKGPVEIPRHGQRRDVRRRREPEAHPGQCFECMCPASVGVLRGRRVPGRPVQDDLEAFGAGGSVAPAVLRANIKRAVLGHAPGGEVVELALGVGAEKDVVMRKLHPRGRRGEAPDEGRSRLACLRPPCGARRWRCVAALAGRRSPWGSPLPPLRSARLRVPSSALPGPRPGPSCCSSASARRVDLGLGRPLSCATAGLACARLWPAALPEPPPLASPARSRPRPRGCRSGAPPPSVASRARPAAAAGARCPCAARLAAPAAAGGHRGAARRVFPPCDGPRRPLGFCSPPPGPSPASSRRLAPPCPPAAPPARRVRPPPARPASRCARGRGPGSRG